MREKLVYEEFSEDKSYKFEVYKNVNSYEIWVQKRITDEYMGDDWFAYHDISDYMHCADTLERAVEIGKECLRGLV